MGKLQTFSYCVVNLSGYVIETMRFSKKDSIKTYMDYMFGKESGIKWSELNHDYPHLKCVKVELKVLTQLNVQLLNLK